MPREHASRTAFVTGDGLFIAIAVPPGSIVDATIRGYPGRLAARRLAEARSLSSLPGSVREQ
jgi:hypothetical protein